MLNAINDIAIKQAQTKALQDQFGFSNPLLSPFINALKGLADRF